MCVCEGDRERVCALIDVTCVCVATHFFESQVVGGSVTNEKATELTFYWTRLRQLLQQPLLVKIKRKN